MGFGQKYKNSTFSTMRLGDSERNVIVSAIYTLDPKAEIYLFGSRVDPSKRGGDIDLLVMSQKLSSNDCFQIKCLIFEKIAEQKIDILIAKDTSDPFVRLALKEGVRL